VTLCASRPELCQPCRHLEEVTGHSLLRRLVHRGGLRARLLTSATIAVGDEGAAVRVEEGFGVIVSRGGKELLGRRLSNHGHGTWSFPGGEPAAGEGVLACALRELHEETGLSASSGLPPPLFAPVASLPRRLFRRRPALPAGGTPREARVSNEGVHGGNRVSPVKASEAKRETLRRGMPPAVGAPDAECAAMIDPIDQPLVLRVRIEPDAGAVTGPPPPPPLPFAAKALERREEALAVRERELEERACELEHDAVTASDRIRLAQKRKRLQELEDELAERAVTLDDREAELDTRESEFEMGVSEREERLELKRAELAELELTLARKERELNAYVAQLQGSMARDSSWYDQAASA
jgi:8-oxo-dGTP pyrophosphatase MutT (NUDIX family)